MAKYLVSIKPMEDVHDWAEAICCCQAECSEKIIEHLNVLSQGTKMLEEAIRLTNYANEILCKEH